MKIKIIRQIHKPDTIDGILKIRGNRMADTTENAHYALPEGEYRITSTSEFRRYIGVGNGVYNLKTHTVYVGKRLVPGVVIKSRRYYEPIYERVRKAVQRKQEVVLVIRNLIK